MADAILIGAAFIVAAVLVAIGATLLRSGIIHLFQGSKRDG